MNQHSVGEQLTVRDAASVVDAACQAAVRACCKSVSRLNSPSAFSSALVAAMT